MGIGYEWKCPKCKYRLMTDFGVGFLYPKIYVKTIEEAKNGELGEVLQELLSVYPDAAINPRLELFQCCECGDYANRRLLDSYVPKEGVELPKPSGRWASGFSGEGLSYVYNFDAEKYYDFYEEYDHRCNKCGAK